MKIVAIMPIKLNNERLPGKNTRMLGKFPLIHYALNELLKVSQINKIYVYCSEEEIISFLPENVTYLKRAKELDLPTSNFNQIFKSFMNEIDADIYVYSHATAPFINVATICECIDKVKNERYDSAFTAIKIQDFLWKNNKPLNFDPLNLPRSQDIEPIYRETSGIYVFKKDTYLKYKRRIGIEPYIREVSFKEAIDINTPEDFKLAETMLNIQI